ncbi:MAG: adenylate kinase [Bacteroidetes bacterium]|nr:MAG: adenylate kinase [Bacteroidota bacterium]
MLNIIVFGPPGAGKGTQSKLLMSRYNLNYISTGELLRKEIREGTDIGKKVKDQIEAGGLADDETIVKLINKAIRNHEGSDGFLFDGFPRTYVQAYILDGLFIRLQRTLTRIFILDIPEEECVKRLLQRAKEQDRKDDNETVIKKRLEEYHQKTLPVLDFYKNTGLLTHVDAIGTSEEIFSRIKKHINEDIKKHSINVVMFGYPGAGMTTQASRLAKEFDLTMIATRELLQEEVKQQTAIGKQIQPYMEKGLLLPDEIVIRLIETKIQDTSGNGRGYVLKGYPRTLVQAYILDGILKKKGHAINCVINLNVTYIELMKRLDERSRTEKMMPYDSSASTIVSRLEEHELHSDAVLEYYRQHNQVIDVDGTGEIEEVYKRVREPVLRASKNLR